MPKNKVVYNVKIEFTGERKLEDIIREKVLDDIKREVNMKERTADEE